MKNCIFLILLLDFIEFQSCTQLTNVSEEVCLVTWFRRKRSNIEYTRWRFNADTTSEFIVKVLDDDITTAIPSQIVAVNILPVTNREEKIIVGGAMVPPPTVISIADLPREYTRFVPPTTAVPQINDDVFMPMASALPPIPNADASLPIKPEPPPLNKEPPYFPPNPLGRNVFRDESPPASPQFIARMIPTMAARQYAPIAPVVFTRRNDRPLTSPTYESHISYIQPTRSSISQLVPSRTIPEEFPFFHTIDEDGNENDVILSRTSVKDGPERTTLTTTTESFIDEDLDHFHDTSKSDLDLVTVGNYDEVKPYTDNYIKYNSDKDSDSNSNNMLLYNYDYKDKISQKIFQYYEDKSKNQEENEHLEKDTSETLVVDEQFLDSKTAEPPIYPDHNIESSYENSSLSSGTETDTAFRVLPPKFNDEKSRDKRRPVCNMIKLSQLNFNSPRTLPEIVAQMKQWAEESPVARWVDITSGNLTTMENPIYMMIVDDTSVGQVASEKQNAFIIAGIQGRDHHAVTAAMYILFQLIERSETHYDLLSKYRFWVIPVFNPDGYDYSMTFPHKREWMKNLRQTWDICKGRESCKFCDSFGLRCTVSPCYGVNLDRNFEYQWIPTEELRAEHPCGNLYAGTRQLSEPETAALSNYLHRLNMPMNIFIIFKEGDILGVMYPHSHIRKRRPLDSIYRQRAGRAAASAYSIAGRLYVAGQTSEFLPLYAGGIEDWADGHLGIDNVYTVMMFRLADTHQSKIIMERVVHEAYAAMDSLLLSSLVNNLRTPLLTLTKAEAFSFQPTCFTILLICIGPLLYS